MTNYHVVAKLVHDPDRYRVEVIDQAGRTRAANVIDCAHDRESIAGAIRRALDPAFRASISNLQNPYGDGHAAERIVSRLLEVELGNKLLVKRFVDLPAAR